MDQLNSVSGEYISIFWEGGKGRPLEEPRGLVYDERGRLVTVSNKKKDSLQIFDCCCCFVVVVVVFIFETSKMDNELMKYES